MTDELSTKPTIETILERINAFDAKFDSRIDQLESRVDSRIDQLESRFDRLDNRVDQLESQITDRFEQVYTEIDRVASTVHSTRAEMLALRVDFRELRAQLKEVFPTPQTS